jgi:hypothetical protein
MKDFIRGLFGTKERHVPAIYKSFAAEYGFSDMEHLLDLGWRYISSKLADRRFQSRVLFPTYGLPTPQTFNSNEFGTGFYPLFLKAGPKASLVTRKEELERYSRLLEFDGTMLQRCIENAAPRRAYIRTVVDPYLEKEKSILGSVVFYSLDDDRWNYPPENWGTIPLTGKMKKLSLLEKDILSGLDIDNRNPMMPHAVQSGILDSLDGDGNSIFAILRDYHMLGIGPPGIDSVYGSPFTFENGYQTREQRWEFLEVQHGTDDSRLKDSGAWIG